MENRKTRKVPAAESVLVTRPNLKLLVIVLFVAVIGAGLFASSALASAIDSRNPNLYAASSSAWRNYYASSSDGSWVEPQAASHSSRSSVTKYTSVKVSWTTWSSLWQRLIGHFKRDLTPSENDTTNNQSTSTQSTGASSQ